jgi:glutamate N-acetyltransferase/amino-acid N-acetyltransferase
MNTRHHTAPQAVSPGTLPRGFRFAATACGLKRNGKLDLALILSDAPASAAAVFTTNRVQAAPVKVSREHVRRARGRMRAIVVNAGNANCSTGPAGPAASRTTAQRLAALAGCRTEEVFVCSTGVIGVPLPVERILRALPELAGQCAASAENYAQLTRAIMTTDTRPKWAAASCRIAGKTVRVLGCAKGAGMIHPQMATMLGFVLTDAAIAPAALRSALREVVGRTFNRITVDGDTSTNDTVVVFASGASGAVLGNGNLRRFTEALEAVCKRLALAIVADGEGAQRVVEIEVRGAPSHRAADRVARTIAHSPLVKTALAGADPNWGRILAAAGRAGVPFDPDRADIRLAGIPVYARGRALPFDEQRAHRKLLAPYVSMVVDLRAGRGARSAGRTTIWTCDFTADYVSINAEYRT